MNSVVARSSQMALALHLLPQHELDGDVVSRDELLEPGARRSVVWKAGVGEARDFATAIDLYASSGLEHETIRARFRQSAFTTLPIHFRGWRDCYAMPDWGVIFGDDGGVNPEVSAHARWSSPDLSALPGVIQSAGRPSLTAGTIERAPHIARPHLVLHHAARNSFGHWMMDCIPGVWVLSEEIRAGRLRLLSAPLARGHRQALEALGVSASCVTESSSDLVRCEYLIAPSCLSMSGTAHPSALLGECLRDIRRRCRPDNRLPQFRHIYLGRTPGDRRTMRNENELIRALEARGFVVVYPRHLSFAQQVHLCAGAKCIVGPHGSGMVNAAYMDPGCQVVEISPVISNPNFWIARLSAVLGLRYAAVVVDVAAEDCDQSVTVGVTRPHLHYRYDADIPAVLHALDVFGVH